MKKYWILLSFTAALAMFVGGFFLVSDQTRNSDPRSSVPIAEVTKVDMNGTWIEKSTGSETFTATIASGEITVDISNGDTSGLYWSGTFPVGSILAEGFTLTSNGDTAAMNASLLGSQAKTKTFTYKDGDLSFEFSAMGLTTTVHLQRSSE